MGRDAKFEGLSLEVSSKVYMPRRVCTVDEIATNIITHGYAEAGLTGEIYLQAEIDDTCLTLAMEDTGIIYNPTTKASLEHEYLNQSLETREIGGLGIHLVLASVDEFHYEQVKNRNRNVFIMYRNQ